MSTGNQKNHNIASVEARPLGRYAKVMAIDSGENAGMLRRNLCARYSTVTSFWQVASMLSS